MVNLVSLEQMAERTNEYASLLKDLNRRRLSYKKELKKNSHRTLFIMHDWYSDRLELMNRIEPRIKRMYKNHLERTIKMVDNE